MTVYEKKAKNDIPHLRVSVALLGEIVASRSKETTEVTVLTNIS